MSASEHGSLFDDTPDQWEEHAKHLRECDSCRKSLVEFAKPMAKRVRAQMERDLGRELSEDEKKLVSKSMLIQASYVLANHIRQSAEIAKLVGGKLPPGPFNLAKMPEA